MSASTESSQADPDRPLDAEALAAMPDGQIDYSDVPELDDAFWENAVVVEPPAREKISIRLDAEVLAFFRRGGPGYQRRINDVLRSYVRTMQRRQGA